MYTDKGATEMEILLGTSIENGLSGEEAEKRRKQYGENRLKDRKKKSVAALFFEQLNDPLIYILMVAIAVSLFLKEVGDAGIIAVVIILNAVVGVIQEGKARKAIEALQKLSSPKALVKRDGKEKEIESGLLVPGDVVFLEAGRQVPADIRLIRAVNLKIEESALTGESVPTEKTGTPLKGNGESLGDRINMAYMTTTVTYGRGEGIVTATGMDTEIGKIADLIEDGGNEMTPLQKRLADLGKVLSAAAVAICLFLFLVAVLQKRDIGEMLLTAISLAVAAVPEGLPAIVTIVLALSVSKMVKVNTIVRKLPSVETLGAVNVVCSDKTGTLTKNRMTVQKCFVDGKILEKGMLDPKKHGLLLEACTLCNDAAIEDERIGDPTELSLLDLALEFGYEKEQLAKKYPRIDERAFDSGRKRMTTVHKREGREIAYVKGAADEMISRCSQVWMYGKETPFTARAKKEALNAIDEMAKDALRVLSVAVKTKGNLTDESNMTFVGLVGMIDPPREEVKEAVESFRNAHVDTVMITGDHVDTALAIARELGIAKTRNQCLTGVEMDALSEEEFAKKADNIRVYARVSPEHKVRIVDALKKKGKVVAMTGDGINDAPSLKAADVGIAMGKGGTDVARNAADMVLTDDNFATIEKAMREGRSIYENIRKTILFLLSSNFGEIITMLAAVLAGFPAPLKASHILWVNLITDSLPALALGVDKNDTDDLMREPPRKSKDSLFSHGGLTCTLCYGAVIASISLLAFLTVPYQELLKENMPVNLMNLNKILQVTSVLNKAQTHAFTVLGMSQLVHAIGMRDVNKSVFKMNHLNNPYMFLAWGMGLFLQVIVTEIPYFVGLFGTSRLTLYEWGILGGLSCMPLVIHELLVLSESIVNGMGTGELEKSGDGEQKKQHGGEEGEAA
ncbi:MAG: cation-translocating P-type ATPase [Suilimivivens sp.]